MAKQDHLQHLALVPLFSLCSQKELGMIEQRTTARTVDAGKHLTEEGQRGDELFVITEGACEVSRKGEVVATLGKGDFFGELALLDTPVRDATVTAVDDVRVLAIHRRDFDLLLTQVPSISRKMLKALARRLHSVDELS